MVRGPPELSTSDSHLPGTDGGAHAQVSQCLASMFVVTDFAEHRGTRAYLLIVVLMLASLLLSQLGRSGNQLPADVETVTIVAAALDTKAHGLINSGLPTFNLVARTAS